MMQCCTDNEKCKEFLGKNFKIDWQNTEQGIRVEIHPKDPEKTKAFQETVNYLRELCTDCGCECCCCKC